MHYDRDESGDLGPEEVAQVLQVRNRLRDPVGGLGVGRGAAPEGEGRRCCRRHLGYGPEEVQVRNRLRDSMGERRGKGHRGCRRHLGPEPEEVAQVLQAGSGWGSGVEAVAGTSVTVVMGLRRSHKCCRGEQPGRARQGAEGQQAQEGARGHAGDPSCTKRCFGAVGLPCFCSPATLYTGVSPTLAPTPCPSLSPPLPTPLTCPALCMPPSRPRACA